MTNDKFKEALLAWADKVIEAQRQFDEEDRNKPDVWYRPDLMAEVAREILDKGFER